MVSLTPRHTTTLLAEARRNCSLQPARCYCIALRPYLSHSSARVRASPAMAGTRRRAARIRTTLPSPVMTW